MSIQSSFNQAVGTAGALAAFGLNEKAKNVEIESQIAESEQNKAEALKAFRNDTIEAAIAIGSHEDSFNPAIGDKKFKDLSTQDLSNLTDDEIDSLGKEVDAFRSGKLTEDRINRMTEASNKPELSFVKNEDGSTSIVSRNDYLNKAYESYRELNNRIKASRALKFDIEAARDKINALKNKDKGIFQKKIGGNK